MCVAIFKNRGIELPSDDTLKKCWEANPDGAGFTVPSEKEGLIEIWKGYTKYEKFLDAFHKKASKDFPMLIHFRIGTSGTRDGRCTHPFPLSCSYDLLTKPHVYTRFALIHNGVLPIKGRDEKWSDTMEFASAIHYGKFESNLHGLQKLITPLLGSNKIAIMNGAGDTVLMGGWIELDGIMFSNSTWKYTYDYSTTPWYWNYANKDYDYGAAYKRNYAGLYGKVAKNVEVTSKGVYINNVFYAFVETADEELVYNSVCPYCSGDLRDERIDTKQVILPATLKNAEFLKCANEKCKRHFVLA